VWWNPEKYPEKLESPRLAISTDLRGVAEL
jgi:hypothetical protein